MNTVSLIGRMATMLLVVIIFEGVMTFGGAFRFESYTAIGIIFQSLVFCICIWAACGWHFEETRERT